MPSDQQNLQLSSALTLIGAVALSAIAWSYTTSPWLSTSELSMNPESIRVWKDHDSYAPDMPTWYDIVATSIENGKSRFYLLNNFRTRSGVRDRNDYFGPFTYHEIIGLYNIEDFFFTLPMTSKSFISRMHVDGKPVIDLTAEEMDQFYHDLAVKRESAIR